MPDPDSRPSYRTNRWRQVLLVCAAGAAILFLLRLLATSPGGELRRELATGLASLSGTVVVAALLLSLVNYGLRFHRWAGLLRQVSGIEVPGMRHGLIYMAGFSLTTTPGKTGELVRHLWLRDAGVSLAQTTLVFGLERVMDVVALGVIALCAVPLLLVSPGLDLTLPLVVGVSFLLTLLVAGRSLRSGWHRSLWARARRLPHVELLWTRFRTVPPGMLVRGLVLGVVAWAAEGLAIWLILDCLAPQPLHSLPQVAGAYALSLIAGAVSLLPGGLGAADLTLSALLVFMGASPGAALVVTATGRVATLWFAVLLGALATLLLAVHGCGTKVTEHD